MSTEVLIVIISVIGNIGVTLLSIWANIYITKLANVDRLKDYNKHLSAFEVEHRSESWVKDIVSSDEFLKYDEETKELIKARYIKLFPVKNMPENSLIDIDD